MSPRTLPSAGCKWHGRLGIRTRSVTPLEPSVSFYCCNMFATTRESIQRIPWHTWRGVYDALVVNGTCHPGRGTRDRDRGKHEAAGAFEHLGFWHHSFGVLAQRTIRGRTGMRRSVDDDRESAGYMCNFRVEN